MTTVTFPVKPGDWVSNSNGRPAKVKAVYECSGEALADLVLYDRKGNRVGRELPACGGPRTFEPACSLDGWHRIAEPSFPIELKWIPNGEGSVVGGYYAGAPLPARQYVPNPRRLRGSGTIDQKISRLAYREANVFRDALQLIADGHNDPRTLAAFVLGNLKLPS